ncbi:mechanosensitive ion channel family protein [Candidatus Woesearchaeota archaeon]|nr:mechanosensitive ion channel family protein [Candidatus Woesearchaeota archaeon]
MIKETVMMWLSRVPYSDYLFNKYVISILILIGALGVAKLLLFVFEKYLEKIAAKTKTEIDDLIFARTKKPIFLLILAYGFKFALLNLEINGWVNKSVNSLMALVFIFILVRVVDVVIDVWGKTFAKKTKSNLDDILLPLFHKATKVVFVVIAFMWVLDIWKVNITPYLAGVGISGIVLGLALQDSLKNIFGGITLVLDKTFMVGDKIKLESGDVGTIHDVGLRSTKLITFDNEVIYIPNGYLANSRVQNYTRPSPKVRVNVGFGVEYGSDVEKVRKTVLGVMKQLKDVLDEPVPVVHFLEMGDSSLNFKARVWVENWGDAFSKKLELTEAIYNGLNKANIGIPFPTRTVYLKK